MAQNDVQSVHTLSYDFIHIVCSSYDVDCPQQQIVFIIYLYISWILPTSSILTPITQSLNHLHLIRQ